MRQFDPWSYWYVSRAMDLFDFGAHGADPAVPGQVTNPERAAALLQLERALVIGVQEDLLFPVEQQRTIDSVLRGAGIDTDYVELSSAYGHDAFLTEEQLFTPVLAGFLRGPGSATSHRSRRAPDSLSR